MNAAYRAVIETLAHGLIVSCQAPVDSPLSDPAVIAAMAQAAVNQGAAGLRIDSPTHVAAVRSRVDVPIIGLWKQQIPGCEVVITPRWRDAQMIAQAGADIIAVDGTGRDRPAGETIPHLIERIHAELDKPVLADIDTWENALAAVAAGADLLATTLYGYTAATQTWPPPGFDLLKKLVDHGAVPVICEGGIATPAMARQALALEAYAVVVGTAITGIDALVQAYQAALRPPTATSETLT